MANKNTAYLLIGGNMGDRETELLLARKSIAAVCGNIVTLSAIYETAPWGMEDQSAFLNQALKIETELSAEELLKKILSIEEALGRKRELRYGPRIIDIDILFFNDDVIKAEGLTVPHPELQNRRFVLQPLAELAAHLIHPVLKKSVAQLLSECPDGLTVQKFQ